MIRSTPVSVLLALAVLAAFGSACGLRAAAAPPHRSSSTAIFVDGSQVRARALLRRGRVFVPLRGVLERLGAQVRYSNRGRIAVSRGGAVVLTFAVGKRRAVSHGRKYDLGAAPFRAYGRVYIPLRAVAQATGASVTYHERPVYVSIYSPASALDGLAAVPAGADAFVATRLAPDSVATPKVDADTRPFAQVALVAAIVALLSAAVGFTLWRRRVKDEPRIVTRAAPWDVR